MNRDVRRLIALGTLAVVACAPLFAQTPSGPVASSACSPSPAALKKRALELTAANNDSDSVLAILDKEVGFDRLVMEGDSPSITIHYEAGLLVALFAPYSSFRFDLAEAIRRREPVADLAVPSLVRISVLPSGMGAPDIVRVIVERNGQTVAPVSNTLKPTLMTTMFIANAMLHSGSVAFSCATFAPGADVKAIAIPDSGDNFEKTFTQRELASIAGLKP